MTNTRVSPAIVELLVASIGGLGRPFTLRVARKLGVQHARANYRPPSRRSYGGTGVKIRGDRREPIIKDAAGRMRVREMMAEVRAKPVGRSTRIA